MCLRNYIALLLVALSFPFTYTNVEFRTGSSSSYIVGIYHDGKFACLGSLITWEYVVTALECVDIAERDKITVEGGSYNTLQKGQGKVRHPSEFIYEEVTGRYLTDIAIIKVETPFEKDSVETIGLCRTVLEPGNEMQVGRLSQTIKELKCCGDYAYGMRASRTITPICAGPTGHLDGGTPAVAGGALCAVAGSYSGPSSRIFTDLSAGSSALKYIKQKTGCS